MSIYSYKEKHNVLVQSLDVGNGITLTEIDAPLSPGE